MGGSVYNWYRLLPLWFNCKCSGANCFSAQSLEGTNELKMNYVDIPNTKLVKNNGMGQTI